MSGASILLLPVFICTVDVEPQTAPPSATAETTEESCTTYFVPPLSSKIFETIVPTDLPVSPELLLLADRTSHRTTGVGTLLSGGLIAQKPSDEGTKRGTQGEKREEQFLISDIIVDGVEGELKEIALNALTLVPNLSYTQSEVNADMDKVVDTGYFRSCSGQPEDTRDGISLRVIVDPNPEIRGIRSCGGTILPQRVFEDAMREVLGRTLNYNSFKVALDKISDWYRAQGIVGEIYTAETPDPTVPELRIREAVIEKIDLRYLDAQTGAVKEEGKVKPEVIMRHMGMKVGSVVNNQQAQRDLQTLFATGLFADVKLLLNMSPSQREDHIRCDLILEVYESRKTGGLGLGAGWSGQSLNDGALPGFVGNVEYIEKNMFGVGQRLVSRMEFGHVDKLFKVEYTEPWILGDKHRTSRTVGIMNNRTSGNPFYASAEGATGIERFKTIIGRLMGSITMSRALSQNWSGTLGLTAQRITLMDDNSRAIRQDFTRAPVNVSGDFHDLMIAPFIKAACSLWGNTQLVLMAEQALPVRQDWLSITKCTARIERIFKFRAVSLVLYAKGGAAFGKVPPYEAFPLGGINSIRGYREGSVGTARHCVEGTAELRVPFFANVQGTLFFDCGSDLDSGSSVIGNPGHSRNKPGRGSGVGFGVRVDSPIGPLRLEWAWNDKRSRLFHAGFGDHR